MNANDIDNLTELWCVMVILVILGGVYIMATCDRRVSTNEPLLETESLCKEIETESVFEKSDKEDELYFCKDRR